MLVWEDEVKNPSSQVPGPVMRQAAPALRAAAFTAGALHDVAPAAALGPDAPAASPVTQATAERRVNAADKRIINGRTDVNQSLA